MLRKRTRTIMLCPICHGPAQPIVNTPGYLECRNCRRGFRHQSAIPEAERSSLPQYHYTEAVVEAIFMRLAQEAGFEVLHTSQHRHQLQCPQCHQWLTDHTHQGLDPGIPDVLITHTAWPEFLWAGFESKGARTPVRPAQQRLADLRRTLIYRDPDLALATLHQLHERLIHHATQNPSA